MVHFWSFSREQEDVALAAAAVGPDQAVQLREVLDADAAGQVLAGVADFITVNANHTFIVDHDEAIRQTLHFLAHGQFDHGGGAGSERTRPT